jgi:hypothetical protein
VTDYHEVFVRIRYIFKQKLSCGLRPTSNRSKSQRGEPSQN